MSSKHENLPSTHIFDYIVIGTGISALQSLQILSKSTKNILVIESQSRLGGRILTEYVVSLPGAEQLSWITDNYEQMKGVVVERGATWIEERHSFMKELCRRFGIELREQNSEGANIHLCKDKPITNKQLMADPKFGPPLLEFFDRADHLSTLYDKQVLCSNSDKLKANRMLQTYDSQTVTDFLEESVVSADVREMLQNFLQHTECLSCDENSMHEVLTKNARSNDLGILKEFVGWNDQHERSYLINEGATALINRFVRQIENAMEETHQKYIKFNEQVITIDNKRADICAITTVNRKSDTLSTFLAKKVICTVPLAVSRSLFITNISASKRFILDNQSRTTCAKSFLIVKKPFWRPHATGDCTFAKQYPINMCHDISPSDLQCGILVFFHSGKKFVQWESKFKTEENECEAKKQYLIETVCKVFSVDEPTRKEYLSECLFYNSTFMNNPHIKSGFQSNSCPGTFSRLIELGDGVDSFYTDENNVHFVGSEYSQRFASYMEGAIRNARTKCYQLIGQHDELSDNQK